MSGAVKRIGFAYNPTSDAAVALCERAASWATVHGLDQWRGAAADREALHRELPGTDVLVVLGGDGTFLRAARAVIRDDVPLLGINVGKVGFLSKVEATDLEKVLVGSMSGAMNAAGTPVDMPAIEPGLVDLLQRAAGKL